MDPNDDVSNLSLATLTHVQATLFREFHFSSPNEEPERINITLQKPLILSSEIDSGDVLLEAGAGGRSYDQHPGNVRLRALVKANLHRYRAASSSNKEKRKVRVEIVKCVGETGRFLKMDKSKKGWYEISWDHALRKVGEHLNYYLRCLKHGSRQGKKPSVQSRADHVQSMSSQSAVKVSCTLERPAFHSPILIPPRDSYPWFDRASHDDLTARSTPENSNSTGSSYFEPHYRQSAEQQHTLVSDHEY